MKTAKYNVLQKMEKYGGGFACALSLAWQHADRQNSARLMAAFPELYDQYEMMIEKVRS